VLTPTIDLPRRIQMAIPSTKADYDPICPHCEKPIKEVHWREIKARTQWEHVFICPHCRKVLGFIATRS
jgi:uncharacterized protein with PIN domain